jgi:ubiquinone biosynthesis protein
MSADRRPDLGDTVRDAVSEWRRAIGRPAPVASTTPGPRVVVPPDDPTRVATPGILAPLPRRSFVNARVGETAPAQMRTVKFETSRARAFLRLFVWLNMLLQFGVAVLWDRLARRNSRAGAAVRLRRILERTGGTFLKLGQHFAMRLDLLPWEYGNELSGLLDRVPPFPSSHAIAMIERTTGKALAETFARFDPEPVGSTSVACTYQAVLRSGERVVVKVRRPGAGGLFMADLRVFDWLAGALEFLTVFRPGYTQSMRRELRETLVEELDFVQEARYMDLFRRAARASGKKFFTAPRVYFELSGEEVIVEEFVAGMWLWELVAAVEQKNEEVLALAARLDIDPHRIARRLTWINYWGWHEHFFFRANPHPDRIIIGEGGRLTFIDFGSVGAVDRTKRRALEQNMYYAWKQDPLNMARASLILLEPLPAVDPGELAKELEVCNREMLFGFETSRSAREWFARTSAQQWIGLVRLARRFRIAIDFDTLRLLRASVMCDTLSVRLNPGINVIREYRRFAKYRARRARQRFRRRVIKQASRYPDNNRIYLGLERLAETGESLFFRLRHALTIPRVNFTALMGKGSVLAYTSIRLVAHVVAVAAVMGVGVAGAHWISTGEVLAAPAALTEATSLVAFRAIAGLLALVHARRMLFRMDDKDA